MTHDELLAKINEWFGQTSGVGSMTHHEFCVRSDCDCALIDDRHALLHNALRAVVEHLKGWEEWETRWKGHMSMSIAADEERNAKYKLVQELTAIIEKELQ